MYSSMMEWVKELAAIPSPLKTPPIITVALQPKCSTNTLHKGPEKEKYNTKHTSETSMELVQSKYYNPKFFLGTSSNSTTFSTRILQILHKQSYLHHLYLYFCALCSFCMYIPSLKVQISKYQRKTCLRGRTGLPPSPLSRFSQHHYTHSVNQFIPLDMYIWCVYACVCTCTNLCMCVGAIREYGMLLTLNVPNYIRHGI